MYVLGRSGRRRAINIWPGFVDALATLLLVVIFVLMVFMINQYFLSVALSGRDQALDRLHFEISELADLLSLEQSANADLRIDVSQLSSELQSSLGARESLAAQLAALTDSRDAVESRLAQAEAANARVTRDLEDAYKVIDVDREKIEAQLAQLAILQQLRDDLTKRAGTAEVESTRVSRELAVAYKVIEADKEKIQAQLKDLAILKSLHDDLVVKLTQTESARGKQVTLTEKSRARVLLLNRQISALREQLAALTKALDIVEATDKEKEVQIAELGRRLNLALAKKVQDLSRYRSEFFGRLREVLGDRQDVRIVGDRFVFQSEVLFASGSASLGQSGQTQLAQLARTLAQIAAKIPEDLNWVLRVDGHTDRAPINTAEFPSNWELSTARAISVVRFLNQKGIAPEHLAATGFGEFQPLDQGASNNAYRRNRRIELKLTQR